MAASYKPSPAEIEFQDVIKYVEKTSTEQIKLDQDFFNKIINNPNLCNLRLSDFLLKYVIYKVGKFDTEVERFYKNGIATMKEQFPWMYLYFDFINDYKNNNFAIFSLGSSLEKANLLWNTFNTDNIIIEIPFSGSMYDYDEKDKTKIIFKKYKRDDMIWKFPLLIKNNQQFRNLIDTLNANTKDVLITDVKGSGKSLKTLLNLFQAYGINTRRLFFLYITTDVDGVDVDETCLIVSIVDRPSLSPLI